jgi:hypothetical protein
VTGNEQTLSTGSSGIRRRRPFENAAYWNRCQKLVDEQLTNIKVRSSDSVPPAAVMKTLGRYDILLRAPAGYGPG